MKTQKIWIFNIKHVYILHVVADPQTKTNQENTKGLCSKQLAKYITTH